jgi:hypothetical protein
MIMRGRIDFEYFVPDELQTNSRGCTGLPSLRMVSALTANTVLLTSSLGATRRVS